MRMPTFVSKIAPGLLAWGARSLLAPGLLLGTAPAAFAGSRADITILVQPADQVVAPGGRATFKVVAQADRGRLRYQWFRLRAATGPGRDRPEPIPGAVSPAYTTPALGLAQNGAAFSVLLADRRTCVESRWAKVTVRNPSPAPEAELALPVTVHPGDDWMRASVPVQAGMAYDWRLVPGSGTGCLGAGQGTGVVAFSSGKGEGQFQIRAMVWNRSGIRACGSRTVTVQRGVWIVKNGGASTARVQATATLLPSGRVLVAGGAWEVPGNLAEWKPLSTAEIFDPATGTWSPTGSMSSPRASHTATLLPDGTVLVAGGGSRGLATTGTAELYHPATGAWTAAPSMAFPRWGASATLLRDGRVLVAGGNGGSNTAEIYDPAKGAWYPAASMASPRYRHTATRLQDGTVLVAGGTFSGGGAEVFDPASGTWKVVSSLPPTLSATQPTATLLPDGRVLEAGGAAGSGAAIYDPETRGWVPAPGMASARDGHTATLLPDGSVLVVGGSPSHLGAERYVPASGAWVSAAGPAVERSGHTATLLLDGTVMVAGSTGGGALSEIYDPAASSWTPMAGLGSIRAAHTATLLPDGSLLAAGGGAASCLRLETGTRTWEATGSLSVPRSGHTASLLPDGTVLAAGGAGADTRAERYDPASGAWTLTGSLVPGRTGHTATVLMDGSVLVAGGAGAGSDAQIYHPASGTWAPAAPMAAARSGHTATLLGNGKVLVAGGSASAAFEELFDPATGTWSPTGPLAVPRAHFTATLLRDGTVLVAGGDDLRPGRHATYTAERYDPATGTWSPAADLPHYRRNQTATALPDGTVLLVGGDDASDAATNAEPATVVFDPVPGTWREVADPASLRAGHTATLMPDGSVVIAFGNGGDVVTEVFLP